MEAAIHVAEAEEAPGWPSGGPGSTGTLRRPGTPCFLSPKCWAGLALRPTGRSDGYVRQCARLPGTRNLLPNPNDLCINNVRLPSTSLCSLDASQRISRNACGQVT